MNTDIERITASVRFHMTSAIISLVSTVESANVYMSCFHYWKLNTQHTLNRAHVKPRTRQTAHTPNHAHTTPLPHRWPADHILLLSLTAHRYLLGQSVGITDRGSESPMGGSEEHTSELQSRPHISYADFCLEKKRLAQREGAIGAVPDAYTIHFRSRIGLLDEAFAVGAKIRMADDQRPVDPPKGRRCADRDNDQDAKEPSKHASTSKNAQLA